MAKLVDKMAALSTSDEKFSVSDASGKSLDVTELASAVNKDVRALEPFYEPLKKGVAEQDETKARSALAAVSALAR